MCQDQAIFIDLPNFYSQLIRSKLEASDFLRDYFLTWLDFDILADTLVAKNSTASVWIFYSGERLGPSDARIDGKFLKQYIERVNKLVGTTAYNVNIPGDQREFLKLECPHCGKEADAEWKSEKGIDASLTVHLFDTMESWQVAYLLSGDADFVPAVKSLRRRGKIVAGAGIHSLASAALIRECYNYIDLHEWYFETDFILYRIFQKDGFGYKWFNGMQKTSRPIELFFQLSSGEIDEHYLLVFTVRGACDLTNWEQELSSANAHFQKVSDATPPVVYYKFSFHNRHLGMILRNFRAFARSLESIKGIQNKLNPTASAPRFKFYLKHTT